MSCSTSDICPAGFSTRNNDTFCLPNRCHCQDGIAAHSNYDYMSSICGITSKESIGNDDEHREEMRLNSAEPG